MRLAQQCRRNHARQSWRAAMSDDIHEGLRALIAWHGRAAVLRAISDVADDASTRRLVGEAALIEQWRADHPRCVGSP
jgi:hypothetical protein